ncbi:MAG: sigma-E processing peptidase SpoIIGA [Firmicutes bacterium]|nr:sigma-E processing peptidase SpoIIGA [Bacillota bacterium]
MYIYAEYLLLENFIINYIILYVTKRFTRTDTKNIRIILASLLGALYTLVVFYPSLYFMTKFAIKISVSVLMIVIAYNPAKIKKFLKLFSTFYIISFVFAGASLAIFYLTNVKFYVGKGIFYIKDFSFKYLLIAVIISWLLFKIVWGFIQTRISKDHVYIPITIKLNGNMVNLKALLDTGNSLKDPISDIPVIVAEFKAIKQLLPVDIQMIFDKYDEDDLEIITNILSKSVDEIKFRIIPFKSLGKENGMLLGFKPDKVIINQDEEKILSQIVVGIYNNNLSKDNDYVALLHPEILD